MQLREAWEETGLTHVDYLLAHWGDLVPVRGNRLMRSWRIGTPGTVGVVNPEEADDVFRGQ